MAENDRNTVESSTARTDACLARNGGLSYLEIPAADAQHSAAFYEQVLGWKIERRGADDFRFEDGTKHLIGRWIVGRAASREPGLLPYYYVDRIDAAVGRVLSNGGEVVKKPYPEGTLWVATVRDPAGNLIGLWQEGRRQGRIVKSKE